MGARDPRDLPAFRAWFGESKVVDEQGLPLVVYHGTRAEFSVFESSRFEGLGGRGEDGFYFTPVEWVAQSISENIDGMGSPRVIAAYLSLQDPVVIDMRGEDGSVVDRLNRARRQGHDGAIIKRWNDGTHPDDGDPIPIQYVAFRSEQIKLAIGNRGTYDPQSPDIRHSLAQRGA